MASYRNDSKGAMPSQPQPYYGGPPPAKQPSIIFKAKRGGKSACAVLGCLALVIVLGGGGLGSCMFYTRLYLPKKAQDYINKTEPSFEKVNGIIKEIDANILASSDEEKEKRSYKEIEAQVDRACDLAGALLEETAAARKSIPGDSSIAEGLDRSLKEYYNLTGDFGKAYAKLAGFYRETLPIMKGMDDVSRDFTTLQIKSLTDITKASETFKDKAKELETFRYNFEKLEVNNDTREAGEQMVKLIDGLVVYLNETARALKTLKAGAKKWSSRLLTKSKKDSKKAEDNFGKVLEEFEEKNKEINRKIKEKLGAKIGELVDKQLLVENYYNSLKKKYNLNVSETRKIHKK